MGKMEFRAKYSKTSSVTHKKDKNLIKSNSAILYIANG